MNTAQARAAFVRACTLDVVVRKPGNVSLASPGHGMQAAQFTASAQAASVPLFQAGCSVGERIAGAVAASWAAAGCNTNLGIVLLCAPVALAVEKSPRVHTAVSLRAAIEVVLSELTVADARAAFLGIAQANPGGLGSAPQQDVRNEPEVTLRAAMALAAGRDSIALQYSNGYRELFELGLAALPLGFSPITVTDTGTDTAAVAAVQRLYLGLLSGLPDSHIVRKHGSTVAQNVMSAAQPWFARAAAGKALDCDPEFAAWDETLKSLRVNPGTTADMTVATLLLAALTAPAAG
jgi:triphosphoribosyl-dephospho-CoA synthase